MSRYKDESEMKYRCKYVSEMKLKPIKNSTGLLALGIHMIDLTDSCFKGVKIRNKDEISW